MINNFFLAPTSFAMAITEGTKLNMRMPCTTRRRPFQAYGVATQYIIESCPRHSVVVRLSRKAMPRNVWPNRELHKHVGVTCTRALWEHCDWKFARPCCRGKNKNKKCACAEFIICFRTAKTCKLKKNNWQTKTAGNHVYIVENWYGEGDAMCFVTPCLGQSCFVAGDWKRAIYWVKQPGWLYCGDPAGVYIRDKYFVFHRAV